MPKLIIHDNNGTAICQPMTPISWNVRVVKNAPGSAEVVVPYSSDAFNSWNVDQPFAYMVHDNGYVSSGPVDRSFSYERNGIDWNSPITINWSDNVALLGDRIIYPDPASEATSQTATNTYSCAGVDYLQSIRNLVELNAGPSALVDRRTARLSVASGAAYGSNSDREYRYENLLTAIQDVSRQLNFVFRVENTISDLTFSVEKAADKRDLIRFSPKMGNVRSMKISGDLPTCTAAIVGGAGEGTARAMREVVEWWDRRIERFIEGGNVSATNGLFEVGSETLNRETFSVTTEADVVFSDTLKFGDTVNVGDVVSVEAFPGYTWYAPIESAEISGSVETGESIVLKVGPYGASLEMTPVEWMRRLAAEMQKISGSR